jgi:hypothetical protein
VQVFEERLDNWERGLKLCSDILEQVTSQFRQVISMRANLLVSIQDA